MRRPMRSVRSRGKLPWHLERNLYTYPMETKTTRFERETGRIYKREFVPAVLSYVVITVAIVVLVDFEEAGSWKYLVAVLPMLPALWGVAAIARHLRRLDEFQRTVQLSGMAAGFAVAMVSAMTLGFLGIAGLDASKMGPWIIYSAGMFAWIVGSGLATRRGS